MTEMGGVRSIAVYCSTSEGFMPHNAFRLRIYFDWIVFWSRRCGTGKIFDADGRACGALRRRAV